MDSTNEDDNAGPLVLKRCSIECFESGDRGEPTVWHLLTVGIDAAAIVLVALIAARFLTAAPHSRNARLVALMCLATISYLLASRQDYAPLLPEAFTLRFGAFFPVLNLLRNSTAALFMLLCHGIFRDGRRVAPWLLGLAALQILLEEPLEWLVLGGSDLAVTTWQLLLFEVVPAALQIAFLGVALYLMLESRESDLVEARRHTRTVFRVIFAVQMVGALLIEKVMFILNLIPVQAMYPIHVTFATLAFLTAIVLLWSLMRTDVAAYIDPLVPEPVRVPFETDTSAMDVARIRLAFEQQHVYREAGLTVAGLARRLALPEYRLRKLIHGHLGYRNFNALLHDYRIGEVSAALADSARNGTPVLTLALSAGYQSLTPFNRAFRELKGMTPTEYRAWSQKVANSSTENGSPAHIPEIDRPNEQSPRP
jgi:AraC-like DNA-binding protein